MLGIIVFFLVIGILFSLFSKNKYDCKNNVDESEDFENSYFPKLSDNEITDIANMLIKRTKRDGSANLRDICKDHYGPTFYKNWQFSRIGHYMNRYKFKSDVYPLNDYKIVVIFEDNVNRVGTVTDVIVSKMK
nr:hypothetical protein [uncultured Macellibacteroides sp.]